MSTAAKPILPDRPPSDPPNKPQGVPLCFKRSPRREALAKSKAEVVRIGTNGTREGFKFAERVMKTLPELRNA
jgi:hypothetical protein